MVIIEAQDCQENKLRLHLCCHGREAFQFRLWHAVQLHQQPTRPQLQIDIAFLPSCLSIVRLHLPTHISRALMGLNCLVSLEAAGKGISASS